MPPSILRALRPPRTAFSADSCSMADGAAAHTMSALRPSKRSRLWNCDSEPRKLSNGISMSSQLAVMSSSTPASQNACWTASSMSSSGSARRSIAAISVPLTVPEPSTSRSEKTLRALSTKMSLYLDCSTCQSIWLARNWALVTVPVSSPKPICCRRWIASSRVTSKPMWMRLSARSPTSMDSVLKSSRWSSFWRTSASDTLTAGSSGSE
mmetsp:Transcript_24688/g.68700  ORF Transcript_24688/g.68700 Transcript_24688/m.68700 type:complete len:210 (+) Transcript_24688:458-1087(+)